MDIWHTALTMLRHYLFCFSLSRSLCRSLVRLSAWLFSSSRAPLQASHCLSFSSNSSFRDSSSTTCSSSMLHVVFSVSMFWNESTDWREHLRTSWNVDEELITHWTYSERMYLFRQSELYIKFDCIVWVHAFVILTCFWLLRCISRSATSLLSRSTSWLSCSWSSRSSDASSSCLDR